jgi:hypothetical protein
MVESPAEASVQAWGRGVLVGAGQSAGPRAAHRSGNVAIECIPWADVVAGPVSRLAALPWAVQMVGNAASDHRIRDVLRVGVVPVSGGASQNMVERSCCEVPEGRRSSSQLYAYEYGPIAC